MSPCNENIEDVCFCAYWDLINTNISELGEITEKNKVSNLDLHCIPHKLLIFLANAFLTKIPYQFRY